MYYIAVVLPPAQEVLVKQHKLWIKEHVGSAAALRSPGHITIIPPFWMNDESEEKLLHHTRQFCSPIKPIPISTNNFGSFGPKTIFIAVNENIQLNQLQKAAEEYFSHLNYPVKISERPFHPHITIAFRDLHKSAFAEAWEKYAKEVFEESFEACGLSILKHNGKSWDVIHTALFSGEGML